MIYYFILFSLAFLSLYEYISAQKKDNLVVAQKRNIQLFNFFAFILIILCIFRGNIGNDYGVYQNIFKYCLNWDFDRDKVESGYVYLNCLFKYIFGNYYFMQVILSLFMLIVFFKNIKDKHESPLFILFIFYVFYYLFLNFVIIRQGFAMVIVIIGTKYIREKRFFLWCLVVLLAMQFHTTAIVAFPLYFSNIKIKPYTAIILFATTVIIEIYGETFVHSILDIISSASFLPETLSKLFTLYSDSDKFGTRVESEFTLGLVMKYLMYAYLVLLCYLKGENKSQEYFLLNFLIAILFSAMGRNFGVLVRISLYFFICGNGIMLYGLLMKQKILGTKFHNFLVVLYIMFYSFWFHLAFMKKDVSGTMEYDRYVPYKTFFENN